MAGRESKYQYVQQDAWQGVRASTTDTDMHLDTQQYRRTAVQTYRHTEKYEREYRKINKEEQRGAIYSSMHTYTRYI